LGGAPLPGSVAAALAGPLALARRLLGGELARGSAVNLAFAVGNAALAFVASVFAGNALGPAGVGVLALGLFVLDLAGMLDNMGSAGFMRDYAAAEDPVKLATIFRLKVALGVGTAALMVVIAPLLAPALKIPAQLLLVFALVPITSILSTLATMVHESRRRPWRRCAPGTAEAAVKAALFGGFWLTLGIRGDVLAYAWAAVGASVVGALVGALLLPRPRPELAQRDLRDAYLEFGLQAQAAQFLQKLLFWIDILLIDVLLNSHYQQGLYRTAYSVMAFVPLFAGTVAVFLFPAISEASHLGNTARVRELLRRSFETVLVIALPMTAAAILLARPALRLFGPEFVAADWILRALAVIALLPSLLVPFQALFPALGKPGVLLRISAAMLAANAALDLLLIPQWGVAGALVAATATFALGLVLSVVAARRLGVLGGPPA
jgi:O-antigen/teichoic acid export membrane protein